MSEVNEKQDWFRPVSRIANLAFSKKENIYTNLDN
jgi:hypothetical protein